METEAEVEADAPDLLLLPLRSNPNVVVRLDRAPAAADVPTAVTTTNVEPLSPDDADDADDRRAAAATAAEDDEELERRGRDATARRCATPKFIAWAATALGTRAGRRFCSECGALCVSHVNGSVQNYTIKKINITRDDIFVG